MTVTGSHRDGLIKFRRIKWWWSNNNFIFFFPQSCTMRWNYFSRSNLIFVLNLPFQKICYISVFMNTLWGFSQISLAPFCSFLTNQLTLLELLLNMVYLLEMSLSWNFLARASLSCEGSELSRAKLEHFNFRAETELVFFLIHTGSPLKVSFFGPRKNRTNDNPYC